MKNLTRILSLSGVILAGALLSACQAQPAASPAQEIEVTEKTMNTEEIKIDSFTKTSSPSSVADLEAQAKLLQFEDENFSDL